MCLSKYLGDENQGLAYLGQLHGFKLKIPFFYSFKKNKMYTYYKVSLFEVKY